MKKALRIFVALYMLASILTAFGTFGSFAYTDSFDEASLEEKINSVYSEIRARRGKSYKGYCGTFLIDQLNELEIGYYYNGGSLNGNKWFTNLKSGVTSYGYTQTKYAGNDCLYDIIEANEGKDIYNVVISFTYQLGYSYSNPGAGHALLIYAISNGNVYFTENFTFNNIPEGGMIRLSLEDFYNRFNVDYGNAIGAVHFVNKEKELTDKIEAVYAEVENKIHDVNYEFVTAQLEALNIGYVINSGSAQKGALFNSLEASGLTQSGYVQTKFSGSSSLDTIINNYSNELKNVVVSFGDGDTGHSVFIYEYTDGYLYFIEDEDHFGHKKGNAIKMSLEDFCSKYSNQYGNITGVVKFVYKDTEGYITLKNVGAGRLLNIYDDRDVDMTQVTVYKSDKTTGQYFKIIFDEIGFRLYSLCAPDRELSLDQNGNAVILENAYDATWLIEKVSGGYVLRLASNPKMVLASSGNYNSARVVLREYSEGNRFQIWSFSDSEIDKLVKCYKVIFNSDGKKQEVYCSYGETPVSPLVNDFVTNQGISYFDSWDKDLVPVTSNCVYNAKYRFVSVGHEITWDLGDQKIIERFPDGVVPSYGEGVMYDILPCPVTSNAEYKVYQGVFDENGVKYYFGDQRLSGWQIVNGEKRYFSKVSGYMITSPTTIEGVKYHFNSDGSLKNGFSDEIDGTRYYQDGIMMTRFVVIDGKTYYFFAESGLMIKDKTYRIGGYVREFNDDYSINPINGWQQKSGYIYYFVDGVASTGFTQIDGNTYYFLKSDDVYGRAATKWMYIGNKIYYFYATTSATPFILKTEGKIGEIEYEFNSDGSIKYTGFVNCDYANASNNNSAPYIQKKNNTTRYYIDGEMQTGWQYIDGEWYYFYAQGSAYGSGYMCVESRYIGGVWYEFTDEGVCLSK